MFEIKRIITTEDCKANRNKIYLFGDNLQGFGKGGQAIIRDEPNSLGVPTKVNPSMSKDSFFSDDLHYDIIHKSLKEIWIKHLKNETIVVPEFRFGYGLSMIDTYAPRIANLINEFYINVYKTLSLKYYAGIGSRAIPKEIETVMIYIAQELEKRKYILRSGGALGSDSAFETGVKNQNAKDIYLPSKYYNNNPSNLFDIYFKDAEKIASENHLYWNTMKDYTKKIMIRNVYQILGMNMCKPVDFVICWTKDGCESHETRKEETGGTGLAISIASKMGVPVYNLKNKSSLDYVLNNLIK